MGSNVEYITVEKTTALEVDEKKSRFIGVVTHVEDQTAINDFLNSLKKANKDAKHIAYGYVLGKNFDIAKNNDDGEPAGTAGNPISQALAQANITDTMVAVVRYFGGIELGKPKLASTYFKTATEALKQANKIRMANCSVFAMTVKYPDFVPVGTYLRDNHLPIIGADYGDVVSLRVAIPVPDIDKHLSEIKLKVGNDFMCSKTDSIYLKMD